MSPSRRQRKDKEKSLDARVEYDDNGNVTRDGKFRGLNYSYDANNRMTETRWDDQLGVSNAVYDALGQRVRTSINGEWHHYVYDAMGRVIAEYGPSGESTQGGLVRDRVYRGGGLIVTEEAVGECRRTAAQFVRAFFWGALGRQPNAAELSQWVGPIETATGATRLELAKDLGNEIFTSTEYLDRQRTDEEFVADLYWTYLQRPADVDGLKFWVERIALQGRDGVREGFELSNEFAAQVAGICGPGQPASEEMWVMQDHQGSTRAMLNAAGQVVGRHDALPFGDTTGEANEVGPQAPADETTGIHGWWNTIRQRYADLERDAATGLEHATARKYEPWAGRWTSPDPYLGSMNPSDPQSFNRYAYVNNDPVNLVDPTGLDPDYEVIRTNTWDHYYPTRSLGFNFPRMLRIEPSSGGGGTSGGPQESGINHSKILNDTIERVKKRLTGDCLKLFAGIDPSNYLANHVSIGNQTYAGTPFSSSVTLASTLSDTNAKGWRLASGHTVFNQDSTFFSGTLAGKPFPGSALNRTSSIYGLSLDQIRELAVLHELFHVHDVAGFFDDNTGDAQNDLANTKVINSLLRKECGFP